MSSKPSIDKFIKAYILTGLQNGKQAAIEAGYSPKTADQQASRLLKSVKVKDAIKAHQKAELKGFTYSKEKKLRILEDVMQKCAVADADKGMVNAPSVISAIKEHNLMQGHNAPTEIKTQDDTITHVKIEVVSASKD